MKIVRCKVTINDEHSGVRTFSCLISGGKDSVLNQEESKQILLTNEYLSKEDLKFATIEFSSDSKTKNSKNNVSK